MGCVGSSVTWAQDIKQVQLSDRLTCDQIRDIQNTWEIVANHSKPSFEQLFILHKDVSSVFRRITKSPTDSFRKDPTRSTSPDSRLVGSTSMTDALVRSHALLFRETIDATVECLDDCQYLARVLVGLGQIHAGMNVRPYYLSHLWPVFYSALSTILQDTLTHESTQAWRTVFTYIVSMMRLGIDSERRTHAESVGSSPIPDDTQW